LVSKDNEIEQEAITSQNKSKLEERVSAGIHGEPELKKGEKRRYLGEFRERVIKVLTFDQIAEAGVYPEILKAIKNIEAKKLIISRKANLDSAKEYIKLARENGLSFKKVGSPEFKGEIALVVVSDHAVNIEDIKVIAKEDKFKELGLSVKLLNKVGSEICGKCYEDISKKAPEELINFKKRSWIDKLFNSSCVCQK
jgi:uncharacterized protein YueI